MGGLSPRVRGNQTQVGIANLRNRSIPACTGEPADYPRGICDEWVYPRVYGGTLATPRRLSGTYGLSPRVRGNRKSNGSAEIGIGSIPACTGEPEYYDKSSQEQQVYPRVYGGTLPRPGSASRSGGLSPRVRGNRAGPRGLFHRDGSIPACTGEPPAAPGTPAHGRVYPRVYGGTGQ